MANPFTPEQISQILEEFFKVVGTRQYIGARYVPIFGRKGEESIEWDNSAPYEPLTIVLYQGNSYTSRQYVPVGVEITNQEFWAITGNYNAQVELYRREVHEILPLDKTPTEGSTKGATSDGISKAISSETTRATEAEQANATAISSETTRATKAEQANATAISSETTRAKAAESAIQTDIATNTNNIATNTANIATNMLKLGAFVTPQQFGAAGDGTTDDTEAIQQAIDYAVQSTASLKAVVLYGKYLISKSLNVPNNSMIVGSNAVITTAMTDEDDFAFILPSGKVTITNLIIQNGRCFKVGSSTTRTGVSIRIDHITATNVTQFVSCKYSTNYVYITNCNVYSVNVNTTYPIIDIGGYKSTGYDVYSNFIYIINCTLATSASTPTNNIKGISIDTSQFIYIQNSDIDDVGYGIYFTNSTGSMNINNIWVENTAFFRDTYGIYIENTINDFFCTNLNWYDCTHAIFMNNNGIRSRNVNVSGMSNYTGSNSDYIVINNVRGINIDINMEANTNAKACISFLNDALFNKYDSGSFHVGYFSKTTTLDVQNPYNVRPSAYPNIIVNAGSGTTTINKINDNRYTITFRNTSEDYDATILY